MGTDTIACLCVTYRRLALLKQAVRCFQHQTYAPRRLVVVHGADDPDTGAYLAGLDDTRVRAVQVASTKRIPLGELRNESIRHADAALVAQWDDDDWHAPRRLELQAKALHKSPADACVLQRWTMYDARTQNVYISAARTWEASLLAWRERLPAYPPLRRSEDTAVIDQLIARRALVPLDRPELYVYTFHGGNTWDARHWDRNIFAHATELSGAEAEQVRAWLDVDAIHAAKAAPAGLGARLRALLGR